MTYYPFKEWTWNYSIWVASTQVLPGLEVQVVIDSNDRAHISTGSAGYVSFLKEPVEDEITS